LPTPRLAPVHPDRGLPGSFSVDDLHHEIVRDPKRALVSVAATAVATAMEGPKFRQVDDDLLMQVVPMVVLYFLIAGFGTGLGASL